MSTTEPMRARNADECRALGWLPGTRLAGDEGFGETVVEITALGEHEILAKTIIRRGVPEGDHHESTWCLDARDWRVVKAAEPRPDVAETVRAAVGSVLWNASNYPERVQARMLGQDTAPLRDKVTDAVLAALAPAAPAALTTAAELDALPIGAVVVDRHGDAITHDAPGIWLCAETASMGTARLLRYGPFHVLHRPAATDQGGL